MRILAAFLFASVIACNSKGDVGSQGSPGAQGPKGDTGATGAAGPTGPSLWVVDNSVSPVVKVGPVAGYTRATSTLGATVSLFYQQHIWTFVDSGNVDVATSCAFYYTTSNCSGTPYVSLSGGSAGTCIAGRFDLFLHKNSGTGNAWALTSATGTPSTNVASNDSSGTCAANTEQISAVAVMQPTMPPIASGHLDIQQF